MAGCLWKLAVVAAAVIGLNMALTPVNWFVGLVAGAIVFFALMVKWFDIDVFGAIVIVIVSRVVSALIGMPLLSMLPY